MNQGILIVEDEHDVRVTLRMALELEGYQVYSAGNGQQALNMLLNYDVVPSLIILDLMMPVMNGWDFLEVLKQEPKLKHIPVLVTSAAGNRSKVSDVIGFLPKPIRLDQMMDLIQQAQMQKAAGSPRPSTNNNLLN